MEVVAFQGHPFQVHKSHLLKHSFLFFSHLLNITVLEICNDYSSTHFQSIYIFQIKDLIACTSSNLASVPNSVNIIFITLKSET
jgi:hypothetical protein